MEVRMPPALSPERQARALRAVVGAVYLACAAMLVYGAVRFAATVMPRYGDRFRYMLFVFGGLACWMAFRGFRLLFGRTGERIRKP
jgi:hypothetical protein